MKKIALALAASIASTPEMAGPYVNVETNANYTGSDYTSRATDLHIGYENELGSLAYYVQGGKTINVLMALIQSLISLASLVLLSLLQINLAYMVKYLLH